MELGAQRPLVAEARGQSGVGVVGASSTLSSRLLSGLGGFFCNCDQRLDTTRTGGGAVAVNPGPAWKAIGTGDFNADGHSDILFQNAGTGQVSIWEMDGNTKTGGGLVSANPGPSWHAIGTGGGSDILFQNTSGQTSIWDMDGTTRIGGGPVSPVPGPAWRAVGLA
jgi:hypothetical protein